MALARLSTSLGKRQAALEYQWMKRAKCPTPIDEMVNRRVAGEPLQYILGEQPFGPLSIKLRPPVLIPRPETEDWTIRLAELIRPTTTRTLSVLDLGTGTGCIPLLLCHMLPNVRAHGIDISSDAVNLAQENARLCGFTPSQDLPDTRSTFLPLQASFLDPLFPQKTLGLDPPFDLITSNPPYISWSEYLQLSPEVTDYEDSRALFGGPDGLDFYRAIAALVARKGFLNPGATIAVEVGDGQAEHVQQIFHSTARLTSEVWLDPWNKHRTVPSSINLSALTPVLFNFFSLPLTVIMSALLQFAYISRPRSNTYPQTHRHRRSTTPKDCSHYSYPAGRMPRDVWEEIFFHCLPPHPDTPSSNRQSPVPSTAPIVLLQVCKAWRKVALSFPNLWTSLSVVVRDGQAFPPLDVASDWLRRSGELPLELVLCQTNESEGNQEVADEVLALYMRYLPRWRDVRLDIANPTYGRSLQPSSHLQAPLLETFHLTTCWRLTRNEEIMQDLLTMLEVAPRLSSFSVSRLSDLTVSEDTTVAIPWTQLVRLDLGFIPSVGACLSIMNNCPNLESCNLIVDPEAGRLPADPIVLPALTSLELHIRAGELASLIDCAVFPALKNFSLYLQDAYDNHAQWPQASFMDLLSRSKCSLTRLELHDTGVQATQFIECLQHESVFGISELVIHDSRDWTWDPVITPRLVQLLTLRGGTADLSACLLPALKTLDLGKGCWTCPNGLLSEMIESRWRTEKSNITRLERVHIDLHLLEDVYGQDHLRLEKLREEGMKVRLT
ncbi:methyltransferase, partial [Favolaschia claudopus]